MINAELGICTPRKIHAFLMFDSTGKLFNWATVSYAVSRVSNSSKVFRAAPFAMSEATRGIIITALKVIALVVATPHFF